MVMYEHARQSRSRGKQSCKYSETGSEYLPTLMFMKVGEEVGFCYEAWWRVSEVEGKLRIYGTCGDVPSSWLSGLTLEKHWALYIDILTPKTCSARFL